MIEDARIGIEWHTAVLHIVVGAHIVQPSYMVFVLVRHHYGIYAFHLVAQHLLAEIGTRID